MSPPYRDAACQTDNSEAVAALFRSIEQLLGAPAQSLLTSIANQAAAATHGDGEQTASADTTVALASGLASSQADQYPVINRVKGHHHRTGWDTLDWDMYSGGGFRKVKVISRTPSPGYYKDQSLQPMESGGPGGSGFPLMKLPIELRVMIYKMILAPLRFKDDGSDRIWLHVGHPKSSETMPPPHTRGIDYGIKRVRDVDETKIVYFFDGGARPLKQVMPNATFDTFDTFNTFDMDMEFEEDYKQYHDPIEPDCESSDDETHAWQYGPDYVDSDWEEEGDDDAGAKNDARIRDTPEGSHVEHEDKSLTGIWPMTDYITSLLIPATESLYKYDHRLMPKKADVERLRDVESLINANPQIRVEMQTVFWSRTSINFNPGCQVAHFFDSYPLVLSGLKALRICILPGVNDFEATVTSVCKYATKHLALEEFCLEVKADATESGRILRLRKGSEAVKAARSLPVKKWDLRLLIQDGEGYYGVPRPGVVWGRLIALLCPDAIRRMEHEKGIIAAGLTGYKTMYWGECLSTGATMIWPELRGRFKVIEGETVLTSP